MPKSSIAIRTPCLRNSSNRRAASLWCSTSTFSVTSTVSAWAGSPESLSAAITDSVNPGATICRGEIFTQIPMSKDSARQRASCVQAS